jgi:hypothetical protein
VILIQFSPPANFSALAFSSGVMVCGRNTVGSRPSEDLYFSCEAGGSRG